MNNPNQTLQTTAEAQADSSEYDEYGFDKAGVHQNGTLYDQDGFDVHGYDINGDDDSGIDTNFDWDKYENDLDAARERADEAKRYPEESTEEREDR